MPQEFCKEESLLVSEGNGVRCPSCHPNDLSDAAKTDHTRQFSIGPEFPDILILQLKRFAYDRIRGDRQAQRAMGFLCRGDVGAGIHMDFFYLGTGPVH